MKIICKPRSSGKTAELLESNHELIVIPDSGDKSLYGDKNVLWFSEFMESDIKYKNVSMDDCDEILSELAMNKCGGTLNTIVVSNKECEISVVSKFLKSMYRRIFDVCRNMYC